MAKKKPKKQINDKHVERVMMAMIMGKSQSEIETFAAQTLGVESAKITILIAEAKRKITLAADYNRDEQIGTAVTRLNDIYEKSSEEKDYRTALAAQKELSKLMDIYRPKNSEKVATTATKESKELEKIAEHLTQLKLLPDTQPLVEHARVAAEKIRSIDAGQAQ